MSFLREFFESIQPDADKREVEWRSRIKDIQEGANRVVERRTMPVRYWGFWQDDAMTQSHEAKRNDRNLGDIDKALKAMVIQKPELTADAASAKLDKPLRKPTFEVGQVVPY